LLALSAGTSGICSSHRVRIRFGATVLPASACCAVGSRDVMVWQNARLRFRSSGFSTTMAVGMGARNVAGPASCVANV
jgi:hypothetical protein